jgi:hypothetical protein
VRPFRTRSPVGFDDFLTSDRDLKGHLSGVYLDVGGVQLEAFETFQVLSGVGRDAPSDLPGRAASPERSRRDLKGRRLERSVSSDRQPPGRSATKKVSPGGPGDGSLRAHCPHTLPRCKKPVRPSRCRISTDPTYQNKRVSLARPGESDS